MKAKNIFSIIFNILLVGAGGYAITMSLLATNPIAPIVLLYHPHLLFNVLAVLVGIWGIARSIRNLSNEEKEGKFYHFVKLGITTSLILVTTLWLILDVKNFTNLFSDFVKNIPDLILYVVNPVLALIIYLFIDSDHKSHFAHTTSAIILPIIFFGYSILLNLLKVEPWNIFTLSFADKDKLLINILTIAIIVVGTYLVGVLIYLINFGLYKGIYAKYEAQVDTITSVPAEVVEDELTPVSEETEVAEEVTLTEEVKSEPVETVAEAPKEETKKPATKTSTANKATSTAKTKSETKTTTTKKAPAKKAEETKTTSAKKASTVKKAEAPKADTKKPATKTSTTTKAKAPAKAKAAEAPKAADKKESETTAPSKPEYRVYHVSKRQEDSQWQVKFAKGQRAIKLFRTQAEAIEFAKKLAESQNGSIRVHSVKGKIRKA